MYSLTKKVTGLFVAVALIAVVISPVTASAQTSTKPTQNIVEIAVANGNFTTLAQALRCTDLVHVLQSRWAKFTVFAPTDSAFAKAGLNKDNVCTTFKKWQLRNILLYHVNLGEKNAATVLSRSKLWMVNGQKARIDASVPSIADQKISATDIRATNGIIHVIDGVMLPPR